MIAAVRRGLLHLLAPVSRLIGRASVGSKRYAGVLDAIAADLQPGDVIVTRTRWRPTNWLIPGFWSHSGMFVGDGVVEAVWPDVARTPISEFSGTWAAVLRPKRMTAPFRDRAVVEMCNFVGTPYDVMFEPGSKALYCSEAVYAAFKIAKPMWEFELRERMGVKTVTPQDFYVASRYFEVVWTNRRA